MFKHCKYSIYINCDLKIAFKTGGTYGAVKIGYTLYKQFAPLEL
ncbi:MAG: hypothetical protein AAGC65_20940 [Mucilaginibacter sp.]